MCFLCMAEIFYIHDRVLAIVINVIVLNPWGYILIKYVYILQKALPIILNVSAEMASDYN